MNLPIWRRIAVIIPMLIALVLVSSACGKFEDRDAPRGQAGGSIFSEPVTARVTVQDWTGWQREQPEPSYRTVVLRPGTDFTISVLTDPATFRVIGIHNGEVRMQANQEFSVEDEDGKSSLLDTSRLFTLTPDRPLEIGTPTMDGGTSLTFEVI